MVPVSNVGNGLAQRMGGMGAMPVRGTAMPSPVGRPVWGGQPPIQQFPVQGPMTPAPVGAMPGGGGGIPVAPQQFQVAGPSGTALPNGMNTLSPQVGNALRRYLGRAY